MPVQLNKRSIVRAHRNPPGPIVSGRNRPIIIKVHHFEDRQLIWNNRNSVTQGTYLTEDFPREIVSRRRKMTPYLSLAKTLPAKLVEDRLLINGKLYTPKNIEALPDAMKGKSTSTLSKNGVTAFYSSKSPLSNHYPCTLELEGQTYHSVEQFYAAKKAKHAMNQEALNEILTSDNASLAYITSKKIVMEKPLFEEWKRIRVDLLKQGMMAKFNQNPGIATTLKETKEDILVEATRHKYWGAGTVLTDPRIFDAKTWKGANQCGKTLMEVRSDLLA